MFNRITHRQFVGKLLLNLQQDTDMTSKTLLLHLYGRKSGVPLKLRLTSYGYNVPYAGELILYVCNAHAHSSTDVHTTQSTKDYYDAA